jgi:hypothetical protein
MCRPDPQKTGAHASLVSLHRVHVLRHDQYGQNFAYSLNQVTPDTPVIVVLNETPQTSVSHTADMHVYYRTSIPYSGQVFFRERANAYLFRLAPPEQPRRDWSLGAWREQPRGPWSGHAPRLRQDHRVKLAGREGRDGAPSAEEIRHFVGIQRAMLSPRSDRMSSR